MRRNTPRSATISRRSILSFAVFAPVLAVVTGPSAAWAEKAVAPEHNPPGDIPDTQVFIDFTSPAGFSMKVPEGWARSELTDGTRFVDKLDGIVITRSKVKSAPTVENVKSDYLPQLKASGRAVEVSSVGTLDLPAGKAIRISYSSNSEPNPVTEKQVRQENERYLYYRKGLLVSVDLYAPYGADNVDQWRLMSRSFRWQ